MHVQGVTFEVKSGEAVGIVGRTGSGKSSLIVALFRLAEPHQGAIVLDGHNLLDMGLQVSPSLLPFLVSQKNTACLLATMYVGVARAVVLILGRLVSMNLCFVP